MNPTHVLGMNARNQIYVAMNSSKARSIAASKYATKILLLNQGIPTANLFGVLTSPEDVNDFDWKSLEKNFVIKPTNGHAGKGVVAFRTQHKDQEHWSDTLGKVWSLDDLKLHCYDILSGQYSTHGSQHYIIVEERITIHPTLLKYSVGGTPDVRVIVFNQVPVMAMLRLATEESGGRANVTQGAIAVGIDMATGITTHAVQHKSEFIQYLPGTKRKLNGIKIPFWKKLLKTAAEAHAASGLMFSGIDVFLHKELGPMIVEINASPGLTIQVANRAGLRRRLQRVEELNVLNPDHGVRIGQALFAEYFVDPIQTDENLTIISAREPITVYSDTDDNVKTEALISTGQFRSAIAADLAGKLGLIDFDDLLWYQKEYEEGKVPVVEVKIRLHGKLIRTAMTVSKRLNKKKYQLKIGRKDLVGFMIRPEEE